MEPTNTAGNDFGVNTNLNSIGAAPSVDVPLLTGSGFLVNVFQWGGVKKLALTLYPTHLRIDNAKSGQTIDDIQLVDIKRVKNLKTAGEIVIVAPKKHYKISWKNIDVEAIALGGVGGSALNAIRGHSQSAQWVDAITEAQTKLLNPTS